MVAVILPLRLREEMGAALAIAGPPVALVDDDNWRGGTSVYTPTDTNKTTFSLSNGDVPHKMCF